MESLVRVEVQDAEQLLRDLGPLSGPELRALLAVLAAVAARSPFVLAVLTVLLADGETVTNVAVAGEGREPTDAPREVQEPAPTLVV